MYLCLHVTSVRTEKTSDTYDERSWGLYHVHPASQTSECEMCSIRNAESRWLVKAGFSSRLSQLGAGQVDPFRPHPSALQDKMISELVD